MYIYNERNRQSCSNTPDNTEEAAFAKKKKERENQFLSFPNGIGFDKSLLKERLSSLEKIQLFKNAPFV